MQGQARDHPCTAGGQSQRGSTPISPSGPKGKGFAHLRVDGELIPVAPWPRAIALTEHNIELPVATVEVNGKAHEKELPRWCPGLDYGKRVWCRCCRGRRAVREAELTVFSTKRACQAAAPASPSLIPGCSPSTASMAGVPVARALAKASRASSVMIVSAKNSPTASWTPSSTRKRFELCTSCEGARLNPVARNVRFREQGIHAVVAHSVIDVERFVNVLKLSVREEEIARDILVEVKSRLAFLQEVGLGYLTLDRSAPTLSGGEAQRIPWRAARLQPAGCCYVLDDRPFGLHARDNRILLDTLEKLQAKGNTLVVVEHDEDTIKRAHHIIDLGPGAGVRGGEIVPREPLRS